MSGVGLGRTLPLALSFIYPCLIVPKSQNFLNFLKYHDFYVAFSVGYDPLKCSFVWLHMALFRYFLRTLLCFQWVEASRKAL